ncbi:MAG TPA: hypothetical protein VH183_02005 [Burkholderiaceae bacterium]|jgi:hypothetical protein|nr:hypothetical protein [Burkholderiaceae bacterium]
MNKLRPAAIDGEAMIPRELKSAQAISDEVTRILYLDPDVIADGKVPSAPPPHRLREPDVQGCNWDMDCGRSARGHEVALRAAIENVRGRWNLRPDFDIRPRERSLVMVGPGSRPGVGIDDGTTATLELGGIPVMIDGVVSVGTNGRYRGTIAVFATTLEQHEGYCVGESVEFSMRQVFGAASH